LYTVTLTTCTLSKSQMVITISFNGNIADLPIATAGQMRPLMTDTTVSDCKSQWTNIYNYRL